MANRKLQTEIERTLKKVSEGIELFDTIYEKIHNAVNMSQKEKFEGDLKKEIKKLQRYRDQIKTWAASNDVKDKKALIECRKLIETKMENFKALEKDLKTKAYSQAGLNAASKMDPEEQHRDEIRQWISEQTDTFSTLIDALEAEQEQLQLSGKKQRKPDQSKQERLRKIDHHIERHKFHQNRLEIVLRMIDNGNLKPEQVDEIKEDVKYYIDEHQDEDFEENEYLYEDLNLEEAEVFGIVQDEELEEPESPPPEKVEKKKVEKVEKAASPTTPKRNGKKEEKKATPLKTTKPEPTPTTPRSSAPQPVEPPVPPPTLRYASAAAAAAAAKEKEEKVEVPVVKRPQTPPPEKKTLAEKLKQKQEKAPEPIPVPERVPTPVVVEETSSEEILVQLDDEAIDTDLNHMNELVSLFEAIKEKDMDSNTFHSMVDVSFLNTTEAADATRSRSYTPLNPYPVPGYYPQTPLSIFTTTPQIFERFDNDTLFFAFYYRIGSYQQYLAARELKRQSWRYHKRYQTWFQRHDEPAEVNDVYEQGAYIYFDNESTWSQKRKNEFRFLELM